MNMVIPGNVDVGKDDDWTQNTLNVLGGSSADDANADVVNVHAPSVTRAASPVLPPLTSSVAAKKHAKQAAPLRTSSRRAAANSKGKNKDAPPPETGPSVLPINEVATCAKGHGMLIPDVHETVEQKVKRLDQNLYRVADMAADILPAFQKKIDGLQAYIANALAANEPPDIVGMAAEISVIRDIVQSSAGSTNARMDGFQVVLDALIKRARVPAAPSAGTVISGPAPTTAPAPSYQANALAQLSAPPVPPTFHQVAPSSGPIRTAHGPLEVLVHHVSFVKKGPREAANMLVRHVKNIIYRDIQSTGKVFGYPHSVLSIHFRTADTARRFAAAFLPPVQVEFLRSFTVELVDPAGPDDGSPGSLDDITEAPIPSTAAVAASSNAAPPSFM